MDIHGGGQVDICGCGWVDIHGGGWVDIHGGGWVDVCDNIRLKYFVLDILSIISAKSVFYRCI